MSEPDEGDTAGDETIIRYILQHTGGASDEIYARTTATTRVPRMGEYVTLDGRSHYVQSVEHYLRRDDDPADDEILVWLACTGREVLGECEWDCGLDNHPLYGEGTVESFHQSMLGATDERERD